MNGLVIGKRITVGAAINSIAAVLAHFHPDHATAIISAAVPVTFVAQVFIVNTLGITQKEQK